MKSIFILSLFTALTRVLFGGESALTVTYQPLDGLGSVRVVISQVTCHDWYSHSGAATAIGLISAPNVPPTNNPEKATEDVNLASICKVHFEASDIGNPSAPLGLTMDLTKFSIPENIGQTAEEIIRSSLECLRRCLPAKLRNTALTFKSKDSDRAWVDVIVREFNVHKRHKVFHRPREN